MQFYYQCLLNSLSDVLLNSLQNRVINGVYPVSPASWYIAAAVVVGLFLINVDVSFGCWSYLSAMLQ